MNNYYDIDEKLVPDISVSSIHFNNYKVFDDTHFDINDKRFVCFIGGNGCGKTTVLDAINSAFAKYNGYSEERLVALLGKLVRHVDGNSLGGYISSKDDFKLVVRFKVDKEYEVELNKHGIVKDHPKEIKRYLYRMCYYARFDSELHQFQLIRSKWDVFKDLFESVTGYEISENEDIFSASEDPIQEEIFKKYVLGFKVKKPNEIISHKECSAGEKKIIKSFSTLLNKEYTPKIILIDNVEMHVESGRHIELIKSLMRCFPKSQIITTTHSYNISRNFEDRSCIYDLRVIRGSELIKKEPWRIYFSDELKDCISKLESIKDKDEIIKKEIGIGYSLLDSCVDNEKDAKYLERECLEFLNNSYRSFFRNLIQYYNVEKE